MTQLLTLSATTCGNSAAPNGWTSAPNGALELIASTDDTDYAEDTSNLVNTGGSSSVDQGYSLNDTPTDFVTMASVSIRLRYGWATTAPANRTWSTLDARIMNGTQVLAAADSSGTFQTVASNITVSTPTNSSVVAFTYINTTATKTNWDAAVLEMRIVSVRSSGGSSVGRRVYAGEITGTYNGYRPELKYYNGSTWVWKPLKVYIDGQWVYKTLKRWDGTQWVREPD